MSPILELDPRPAGAEIGSSTQSLEGSGKAFPTGLATIFEYNGMIFNKLDTIDKIRVMKIDGLSDADIRDNRENNPSFDGETALDSFYGGRTMTFTGRIEAYRLEKLRDMQQAFRQAFADVGNEYPLIFNTYGFIPDGQGGWKRGPDIYRTAQIYCKKNQPLTMTEEQNDFRFFRDFLLTLRASDPRFTAFIPNFYQWQPTGSGNATQQTIADANNIGNYMAAPKIVLTGPMTNPIVTNTRSGEVIKFNGALPAARKWFIDVGARTLIDLDGASMFRVLDVTSDFFNIYPGLNTIQITATAVTTASMATVEFANSWM